MTSAFRRRFLRDLKKVRAESVRVRARSAIEAVEAADSLADVPGLRKLSGADRFYRIRIGDYRIGLFVDGDTVEFVRLLHRRDMYRYFP